MHRLTVRTEDIETHRHALKGTATHRHALKGTATHSHALKGTATHLHALKDTATRRHALTQPDGSRNSLSVPKVRGGTTGLLKTRKYKGQLLRALYSAVPVGTVYPAAGFDPRPVSVGVFGGQSVIQLVSVLIHSSVTDAV